MDSILVYDEPRHSFRLIRRNGVIVLREVKRAGKRISQTKQRDYSGEQIPSALRSLGFSDMAIREYLRDAEGCL